MLLSPILLYWNLGSKKCSLRASQGEPPSRPVLPACGINSLLQELHLAPSSPHFPKLETAELFWWASLIKSNLPPGRVGYYFIAYSWVLDGIIEHFIVLLTESHLEATDDSNKEAYEDKYDL